MDSFRVLSGLREYTCVGLGRRRRAGTARSSRMSRTGVARLENKAAKKGRRLGRRMGKEAAEGLAREDARRFFASREDSSSLVIPWPVARVSRVTVGLVDCVMVLSNLERESRYVCERGRGSSDASAGVHVASREEQSVKHVRKRRKRGRSMATGVG